MVKPQDLLPCPFCGTSTTDEESHDEWLRLKTPYGDYAGVECFGCGAETALRDWGAEGAIEAWNKRSPAVPFQHDRDQKLTIQDVVAYLSDCKSSWDTSDTAYRVLEDVEDWIEERVQESDSERESGGGAARATPQGKPSAVQ